MLTLIKRPNNIFTTTILVACLLFVSTSSFAKDKRHGFKNHSSMGWAKVTHFEPITRTVEKRQPEKHCWYEEVKYEPDIRHHDSHTGTIVGGIIGGALGNAVGHKKKNKQIGTAVGALLGATIGHDISTRTNDRNTKHRRHLESTPYDYHSQKRCETTHQISYEEEIIGYKVWYRYHGEHYTTRTDHKPGKRIRVRVTVKPA